MAYDAQARTVTDTADEPSGPTADCHTFDALDFVALVAAQIPDKGQVLQRYYGHYSSRARRERRKAAEAAPDTAAAAFGTPEDVSLSAVRRRWAGEWPVVRIIRRLLVRRDKLIEWIDERTGEWADW